MVVEMLIRRVVDGKVVLSVEMVDTSYDPSRPSQNGGDYRRNSLRKENSQADLLRLRSSP